MFTTAKRSAFHISIGAHGMFAARGQLLGNSLRILECLDVSISDTNSLQKTLDVWRSSAKTGATNYVQASCGICSPDAVLRKITLETKRAKDHSYLEETIDAQLRIKSSSFELALLESHSGLDIFAASGGSVKDVIVAGLGTATLETEQERLLSMGIFPQSIELSSLTSIGALFDYLSFTKSTRATLVLELNMDVTNTYIVGPKGLEATRSIPVGLESMVSVVQKELGLKDEESARKLFFSNTFDFTGMGAVLCRRILKELQSSMGFYEVQTGQSIGQMIITELPLKLNWLEAVISHQIGVGLVTFEPVNWLKSHGVEWALGDDAFNLDPRKLALFGLMINPQSAPNA
jgi:Tfp pilus assembly PilM family ATPase